MIENKQRRPMLIASFSGVSGPAPRFMHRGTMLLPNQTAINIVGLLRGCSQTERT
jgi:hypothetical protein